MGSGRNGDGYVSLGCLCFACLSHVLKTCRDAWVAYGSFDDSQSCDFIKSRSDYVATTFYCNQVGVDFLFSSSIGMVLFEVF